MHDKLVALVTGANRGIGLQIVQELADRGITVLLGARDLSRGREAAGRLRGDVRAIALDVTNEASIAAAATRIGEELGRLDILVNNAGIANGPDAREAPDAGKAGDRGKMDAIRANGAPSTTRIASVRAVFETNVFGAIAVTQEMLPLLRAAPAGRVVNVSSRVGSMTIISAPDYPFPGIGGVAYSPSKAALNAVTVAFAQELAGTPIKVNAVCPGYTATDMNDHTGTRTVEQAAREPVRLALLDASGPTGTFRNDDGPIPW